MKYPQLVSMPSAVSDWLEEQLEARGIDAVVYTRYVLSLLHTHTVDVIYPDEDLQFSRLKKEVRRSSGSRKRFRRSSDWWRHAQADAEQIKRSAAVECLMSASDQNCEIESLVDELCEKLKEVNSEPCSPASQEDSTPTTTALKEAQKHKITPQELAEKYYAAFPPLCPQSPSKLISLLPKWKPAASPSKKKNVRKQNNRRASYENKLHCSNDMLRARGQSKPHLSYMNRNKGIHRRSSERVDNVNNWQLCAKKSGTQKLKNITNIQDTLDQCVESHQDIWNNEDDEDEMKMYEDLPVDIQELLDSPSPQDDTVEMMNMANMRDDGKRKFIPYGTNITSSIWSADNDFAYDNKFNAAVEGADSESILDFKFSSISIDNNNPDRSWPSMNSEAENVANSYFEDNRRKRSIFLEGCHSLPEDWASAKEECFEDEHKLSHLAISLMKLNHDKEKSCFAEIMPRPKSVSQMFNPFGRTKSLFNFGSRAVGFERQKEDLLTSERSHFRPINEKVENRTQGQYADGATFVISNSLDKVDYKRSESGSMLLETEFGQSKKYWEYKPEESASSPDLEFVLKFSVSANDKACQTEDVTEVDMHTAGEICKQLKSENADESIEEHTCPCLTTKSNAVFEDGSSGGCLVHPARPESLLSEALWKYDAKTCEKFNNNNVMWNADWFKTDKVDSEWDSQSLRDIWSEGEVCDKCLNLSGGDGRLPPSLQLREDISQDGEQLLSDLSSLQKTYMEDLPLAEVSCDLSEILSASAPKERKRRHSFITAHVDEAGLDSRGSWSFASRLEEDCLIQMATLPTLRSVTL